MNRVDVKDGLGMRYLRWWGFGVNYLTNFFGTSNDFYAGFDANRIGNNIT